jgi:hypothetical protein
VEGDYALQQVVPMSAIIRCDDCAGLALAGIAICNHLEQWRVDSERRGHATGREFGAGGAG